MKEYRADIDGLRAVAILPVLFFHAGLNFFSGGYVGVDVFFVISGFLITRIIYEEIQADQFSILKFYERRARRILPALLVVCVFSSVMAWWLFIPSDFKAFSKTIMSTMLFYSNIQFLEETGYFATASELKPLLHTWSLAVEEQFYIVFPLLMAGVWALWRRALKPAVALFFLASFVGCVILTDMRQVYAFFLSPTRAWELALGSLIAMNVFPVIRSRGAREVISASGLGLIICAILTFDQSTPFPSYFALMPALGAGLLIYGGGYGDTITKRILSLKPFVLIGLVSYSLYLWHWPLIVFAKYQTGGHLSSLMVSGLILVSFVCAAFSWKFVEQPFRQKTGLFSHNKIFVPVICAACLAVFGFGYAGKATSGFPDRWPDDFLALMKKANQNIDKMYACGSYDEKDVKNSRSPCLFGEESKAPDFFVWGDSHSIALFPAFEAAAQKYGQTGAIASYGGCPPLMSVTRLDKRKEHLCLQFNALVTKYLSSHKPRTVFLVARWPLYSDGHNPSGPQAGKITFIGSENHMSYSRENSRKAFIEGLSQTIAFLKMRGVKIVIVEQVPEHNVRIQKALTRAAAIGNDAGSIGTSLKAHDTRQKFVSDVFNGEEKKSAVHLIKPQRALCSEGKCQMTTETGPLYTDYHHLSRLGARTLLPLISPFVAESAEK